jgi:phosphoribosylanthranilate isomerase
VAILERMAADAEHLRGADTPATQRAFALVRAAITLAQTAVVTPTDEDAWTRAYRRARTALVQLHTSLSRTIWRN